MNAPSLTYNPIKTSSLASFTFSAKEKDTETGYSYFGARYYSSDLSIWLSVDPMSDKYPSLSPYTYCANNPIKLTDPDGRWIPGLDDEGNVTYTAEKGDSYDTFIKQFDCRDADGNNRGRDIFSNAGLKKDGSEIKEGSVIKGDAVKQVTGNDVLKGNWNNMTDDQKASQIKFALDYGEKHKTTIGNSYAIDLNEFINDFGSSYSGISLNNVQIPDKNTGTAIVNMRLWPKEGLTDSRGQIPIRWRSQSGGENFNTKYYYSAKNPNARNPLPAIGITRCK